MKLEDDPVTLECKYAAQQWLQSKHPLIQDFGARLLCLLSSANVRFGRKGSHTPPQDLLPEEFEPYPWGPGILRGQHEYLKPCQNVTTSMPLREFYALQECETVGLRLGVFWASPHWRYLPHKCQSLDLHHRLRGFGTYLQRRSDTVEMVHVEPGQTYLHLPNDVYGFESRDEPLLNLWAERVIDVKEVPRMLSELVEIQADAVTCGLTRACHQWLQSDDLVVQLFGQKMRCFLAPRAADKRQVPLAAPPKGMVSAEFRGCPWYPSLAYTNCMDPKLKPLRDCLLYEEGDTMFGLFYAPAGTYYPAHRHEPWEIYHVFEGRGHFFLGDDGGAPAPPLPGDLDPKPQSILPCGPDDFWLHQPYQSHGMQVFERPVLILWGWIGDLSGDYDLRYLEKDIFQCCKLHSSKF